MALRQYVIMSMPAPVYLCEAGVRQDIVAATYVVETSAATPVVVTTTAEWIVRARRRGNR